MYVADVFATDGHRSNMVANKPINAAAEWFAVALWLDHTAPIATITATTAIATNTVVMREEQ